MNSRSQLRSAAACFTFCLLYGCGTTPPSNPPPLPIVQPTQSVDVDPTLVTYCPAVAVIPRTVYSQGATLDPVKYWQDLYTLCSGKQRKLVDLAAQAFNLPTPAPAVLSAYPVKKQKPVTPAVKPTK